MILKHCSEKGVKMRQKDGEHWEGLILQWVSKNWWLLPAISHSQETDAHNGISGFPLTQTNKGKEMLKCFALSLYVHWKSCRCHPNLAFPPTIRDSAGTEGSKTHLEGQPAGPVAPWSPAREKNSVSIHNVDYLSEKNWRSLTFTVQTLPFSSSSYSHWLLLLYKIHHCANGS